jgi:HAD superfamily hydrolase (TIGR01509 family)
VSRTAAVFFDVDFTLIHPGPRFQGEGYRATCAAYGVSVAVDRFDAAVAGASSCLDSADQLFDAQIFINYTRRIIELMGGAGDRVEDAARDIYRDWAGNHHFTLYDDVAETLAQLREHGIRTGLISNGHRSLEDFQSHFALTGLIAVTVSSSDHGYMKPHPSIFHVALERMGVEPFEAVMVGDSLAHDIIGALQVGMRGVLLARGSKTPAPDPDVPVIRTLRELAGLL